MPYALDIARLIAHGTEDRDAFPFYMTDKYRNIYIREVYRRLQRKPEKSRYSADIKLALLNEYVEFIEEDLNNGSLDKNDHYYKKALEAADDINTAVMNGSFV